MVEVITILIFNMAIPTLIPSIIFTILFSTTTIIHLYRSIKTHRAIYGYLFLFSLFRTLAYSTRIAWSQVDYSKVYALLSTSLLTISFFLMFLAIFTLLTDWLKTITSNINTDSKHNSSNNNDNDHYQSAVVTIIESKTSSTSSTVKITKSDLRIIRTIKYFLLPLFSLIGLIGTIKQFDDNGTEDDTSSLSSSPPPTSLIIKKYTVNKNSNDISNILHRISTTSFFITLLSYMVLITYFHLKYSNNKPIHKQLKIFILYIVGFLLLIEMAYKLFIAFSSSAYIMDQYTWIFYIFESFPELIILFVLGGLILGEWFFINNDNLVSIDNNNNIIGSNSNIIHIINSNDDKDNNQNNNLNV